jgi:hypothetical protein
LVDGRLKKRLQDQEAAGGAGPSKRAKREETITIAPSPARGERKKNYFVREKMLSNFFGAHRG